MKHRVIKPVSTAGFLLFVTLVTPSDVARSQGYIDLEAEREAARSTSGQTTASGDASYANSPEAMTADPAMDPAGGIRPYSGQTTTVVPLQVDPTPDGDTAVNTGSMVIQLQQLQEEVRRLTGLVEEQASEIQRLKEQGLERYIDLDRRMAELAVSAGAGAPPGVAGEDTGGGFTFGGSSPRPGDNLAGTGSPAVEPGEEAAYQAAYNHVKARNFSEAVEAFQKFLEQYPLGAFAPNAHYWLGELYLVLDPPDPELARQSFKLLLDQYPENPKVPDALYKLGKVHYLKGNRERSRSYLDRVIAEYPGHPAAQLSRDFLDENF